MVKRVVVFWLSWIVVVATGTMLLSSDSRSSEWLELQKVDLTYRSFFPGGTDPLITENPSLPGRTLGKELDLEVNSNVFDYFYWNSTVHSMTDEVFSSDGLSSNPGQFRMVGLEIGIGVDLRKVSSELPVSIGYYHYSRHVLDATYGSGPFPREDALEVKVHIYDRSYR